MSAMFGRLAQPSENVARLPIAARLFELFGYWFALRQGSGLPLREDFDLVRIAPVLNEFWMLERDRRTGFFRYLTASEELQRVLGRRLTGAHVHEVFPEAASEILRVLGCIAERPSMHYSRGAIFRDGDRAVVGERLVLPLAENGEVSVLLGATLLPRMSEAPRRVLTMARHPFQVIVPSYDLGVRFRFVPACGT
jgi:hypothetical protein